MTLVNYTLCALLGTMVALSIFSARTALSDRATPPATTQIS